MFQAPLTGVTNDVTEFTGYGEATVEIARDLVATGGVRVSHARLGGSGEDVPSALRSEEHTSELQSLMRISYAVFCLKKKNKKISNRRTRNSLRQSNRNNIG